MPEPVFSEVISDLLTSHFTHLNEGSGISIEVMKERGYRSVLGKDELAKAGFTSSQQRTSGILIPLWGVDGVQVGYQYRPDNPRSDSRQRPVKYESPVGLIESPGLPASLQANARRPQDAAMDN